MNIPAFIVRLLEICTRSFFYKYRQIQTARIFYCKYIQHMFAQNFYKQILNHFMVNVFFVKIATLFKKRNIISCIFPNIFDKQMFVYFYQKFLLYSMTRILFINTQHRNKTFQMRLERSVVILNYTWNVRERSRKHCNVRMFPPLSLRLFSKPYKTV